MFVVSQFGITRNGKDLQDREWDVYNAKDENSFEDLEEAMDFYKSINLADIWENELSCRGRYNLMKRQVYAKEVYIFDAEHEEFGDTLEYDEYSYADHKKMERKMTTVESYRAPCGSEGFRIITLDDYYDYEYYCGLRDSYGSAFTCETCTLECNANITIGQYPHTLTDNYFFWRKRCGQHGSRAAHTGGNGKARCCVYATFLAYSLPVAVRTAM